MWILGPQCQQALKCEEHEQQAHLSLTVWKFLMSSSDAGTKR